MKLFVSYASEYKAAAEEVALALTGAGHDVIFDRSWLNAGDDYNSKIRDAMAEVDGVVFLITPEAVRPGSYALTELKFARERWAHPSKRVLPVILVPTPLDMIPPYLKAVTLLQPEGSVPAEVASAVAKWYVEPLQASQERVRVGVHVAVFEHHPHVPAYFINVTNLFAARDIEITHVWFETEPRVHVMRTDRPLPARLRPFESWETWQDVDGLPIAIRHDAFTLARVRLSTGSVIESIKNINVPERGFVPRGSPSSSV